MAGRLIIVHPMDPRGVKVGGIETHVRQILRHAPADMQTLLIGVDDKGDLPLGEVSEVEFSGRKLSFLPVAFVPAEEQKETARSILKSNTVRFILGVLRYLPRLRRIARQGNASIEVERYEIAWLAKMLGRPMVLVIHNDVGDATKQDSLTKYIWRLTKATEWLAYRLAAHVFTVTQRLRDRVEAMAPAVAPRTEVLTVSIDTAMFRPSLFDLSDEVLRIAYAGRLELVKDPALMFSVAAALHRKLGGKFEFHYAGSSDPTRWPEFAAIEQCTVRHGALRTEEMAAMLRRMHVGMLTSHWEGMPCFLLESLSSGRPFAGVHLPQFEKVVRDTLHGRMMERRASVAESAEAWADEIVALWRDIRDGRVDPQRLHEAVQPFSVKRQLGRLFEVHAMLAAGRQVSRSATSTAQIAGPEGGVKAAETPAKRNKAA
jgi:glycosyltransferase involved in cell wall biosynthesis